MPDDLFGNSSPGQTLSFPSFMSNLELSGNDIRPPAFDLFPRFFLGWGQIFATISVGNCGDFPPA